MEKESIKQYLGVRSSIVLQNGYTYKAIIQNVTDSDTTFLDQFNKRFTVANDSIDRINEVSR